MSKLDTFKEHLNLILKSNKRTCYYFVNEIVVDHRGVDVYCDLNCYESGALLKQLFLEDYDFFNHFAEGFCDLLVANDLDLLSVDEVCIYCDDVKIAKIFDLEVGNGGSVFITDEEDEL